MIHNLLNKDDHSGLVALLNKIETMFHSNKILTHSYFHSHPYDKNRTIYVYKDISFT